MGDPCKAPWCSDWMYPHLNEILDLIKSVSEGFPAYSYYIGGSVSDELTRDYAPNL